MDENAKTGIPTEDGTDGTDMDESVGLSQGQEDSEQTEQEPVPMDPDGEMDSSLLAGITGSVQIPEVSAGEDGQTHGLELSDSDAAEAAAQEEDNFLDSVQDSDGTDVQADAVQPMGAESDGVEGKEDDPDAARRIERQNMIRIRAQRNQRKYRNDRAREAKLQEQAAKRAAVWSNLIYARNHNSVVYGKIIGCKVIPGSQELLAIVLFGGIFRVVIPFSEVYVDFPIRSNVDLSSEAGVADFVSRQRAMLEKMYGLETPFRVTEIRTSAEGGYVVLGSRAKAIKQMAIENFVPDSSGNTVMSIGDIVPATITTIAEHTVMLNVGGIDTRLPSRNLTYRYLPNSYELAKYYRVGQEVPVMILDVVKNAAGNLTCLVSGTRAELEDAKNRHDLFCTEGEMTYATISRVFLRKDRLGVTVILYIDGYDLPAVSGNVSPNALGRYPMPGDKVRVAYRNYNEETGMTFVGIRGNHGTIKP